VSIKAPFPWAGGKSRAASLIWERLGNVPNYVEPFFGSGAVLLGRPTAPGIETINDKDGFVCNAWRSIAADPAKTAEYADWPVSECDLHARHVWLVERRAELTARMEGDPDYYDAKIAGWWLWGMACWIGGGFCSGKGPWWAVDGRLVNVGNAGQGVARKLPHLGHAGQGVARQLPHLGHAGQGVAAKGADLLPWFTALSDRLRRVRVCCGDWQRICGDTPTIKQGLTGVVLDPPYSFDERDKDLYAIDSGTVAVDAREWALAHGDDPLMRIVLCGYDTEHIMPGWTEVPWKAHGGYGNQSADGRGSDNAERETLWFSPHCLSGKQGNLFDVDGRGGYHGGKDVSAEMLDRGREMF
jgi:DNA adenine methylase